MNTALSKVKNKFTHQHDSNSAFNFHLLSVQVVGKLQTVVLQDTVLLRIGYVYHRCASNLPDRCEICIFSSYSWQQSRCIYVP